MDKKSVKKQKPANCTMKPEDKDGKSMIKREKDVVINASSIKSEVKQGSSSNLSKKATTVILTSIKREEPDKNMKNVTTPSIEDVKIKREEISSKNMVVPKTELESDDSDTSSKSSASTTKSKNRKNTVIMSKTPPKGNSRVLTIVSIDSSSDEQDDRPNTNNCDPSSTNDNSKAISGEDDASDGSEEVVSRQSNSKQSSITDDDSDNDNASDASDLSKQDRPNSKEVNQDDSNNEDNEEGSVNNEDNDDNDDNEGSKDNEDNEADGGDEGSVSNESISNKSNNSRSERLTVRPAKQLYDTISKEDGAGDATEIIVDDDDDDDDAAEAEGPQVSSVSGDVSEPNTDSAAAIPGGATANVISVLNPQQLGASSNCVAPGINVNYDVQFQPANQYTSAPIDSLQNGIHCDVCNQPYMDEVVLEHHKMSVSHFKCYYCVELTTFSSQAELMNHNNTVHGVQATPGPIDQLSQQVQSLPMPFHPQTLVGQNYNLSQNGSVLITSIVFQKDYPSNQNFTQQQQQPPRPLPPNEQGGQVNSNNFQPTRTPVKRPPPISPRNITPVKRRLEESLMQKNNSSPGRGVADNTVLNQLSKSITVMARQNQNRETGGRNAVASILTNRGLTVTATNNPSSNRGSSQSSNVPMINLNSSVSIIPTNSPNKQTRSPSRGYIPAGKTATVDLTGPDMSNRGGRNKQFTCPVCDKVYYSQDTLNQHMTTHRSSRRYLPYRCDQCTASFSDQADLGQHKSTFHRNNNLNRSATATTNNNTSSEMAIPVVDIKQQSTLTRLRALGITNIIPLSGLGQNINNTFGIPIITTASGRNTPGIKGLEACSTLRIGPLRPLR